MLHAGMHSRGGWKISPLWHREWHGVTRGARRRRDGDSDIRNQTWEVFEIPTFAGNGPFLRWYRSNIPSIPIMNNYSGFESSQLVQGFVHQHYHALTIFYDPLCTYLRRWGQRTPGCLGLHRVESYIPCYPCLTRVLFILCIQVSVYTLIYRIYVPWNGNPFV